MAAAAAGGVAAMAAELANGNSSAWAPDCESESSSPSLLGVVDWMLELCATVIFFAMGFAVSRVLMFLRPHAMKPSVCTGRERQAGYLPDEGVGKGDDDDDMPGAGRSSAQSRDLRAPSVGAEGRDHDKPEAEDEVETRSHPSSSGTGELSAMLAELAAESESLEAWGTEIDEVVDQAVRAHENELERGYDMWMRMVTTSSPDCTSREDSESGDSSSSCGRSAGLTQGVPGPKSEERSRTSSAGARGCGAGRFEDADGGRDRVESTSGEAASRQGEAVPPHQGGSAAGKRSWAYFGGCP